MLPQTYRTLDSWQNAARLPVRIGHKQPLAGASPSPTETVRGIRPLRLIAGCHIQDSVYWLFFYIFFLPDGNKKNKKKSYEYLEATTSVACRGWTLEPWGLLGLGTWRTEGSL